MAQQGCRAKKLRVFKLGNRQYPVDQHFYSAMIEWINPQLPKGSQNRDSQVLTRDQRYALQEHYEFHLSQGNGGIGLEIHMELMRLAIRNGLSFIEAHVWALKIWGGPI